MLILRGLRKYLFFTKKEGGVIIKLVVLLTE